MKRILPLSFLLLLKATTAFCQIPVPAEKETAPVQQNLDIFSLTPVDWAIGAEDIAFISVSDIYPLSGNPDSLAVPELPEQPFEAIQYLVLTGQYRAQLLATTGISEHDKVFVFDYATGKQRTFPVSKLKAVACIDGYAREHDMPLTPSEYMIGFAIDKTALAGFGGPYYLYTLVSIGQKSPFAEKLTPVAWNKTDPKQFPATQKGAMLREESGGFLPNATYSCTLGSLDYLVCEGISGVEEQPAYHVLIRNNRSKIILFENFYSASEGTSMAPLNLTDTDTDSLQWTGQLFKNRNPVIFGFTFESYSCDNIAFIGTLQEEDIYVKCDNRN